MTELVVYGVAQPQGSKTAFVRNGRAVLTDGRNAKAREGFAGWRASIATAARDAQEKAPRGLYSGPLVVTVDFYLPRPKSLPKRVLWPATRPDIDKLARAVLDALTGVLIGNDAQVVHLVARKLFGDPPRAQIWINDKGASS